MADRNEKQVFISYSRYDYLDSNKQVISGNNILTQTMKCFWVGVALTFSICVNAQPTGERAFFTTKEMPDITRILKSPPKEGTPAFDYDIKCYMQGKEQRADSFRCSIAIRDAVYGIETIAHEFSVPFGLLISKDNTPQIYELLERSLATCDSICTNPKKYWHRKRPFAYFNESTLTPQEDDYLKTNGSYPSGHTILGYSAALLLTEINPERADTLMSRGIMYGDSRIIVGAHWNSDVEAGRLAASIAYTRLHTNRQFLKQMKRAKKEFLRIKKRMNHTK